MIKNDLMFKFNSAALHIKSAINLIGSQLTVYELREVHIKTPTADFIRDCAFMIKHEERECTKYPHMYSFNIDGIRFYWIASEKEKIDE